MRGRDRYYHDGTETARYWQVDQAIGEVISKGKRTRSACGCTRTPRLATTPST